METITVSVEHRSILAGLGRAVARASDVAVECLPLLVMAAELRANDPQLERWARRLLADRGWRSVFAVPLDEYGHALVMSDTRSARRWSEVDRALCTLAAESLPRPGFAELLGTCMERAATAGRAVALLLVHTAPPAHGLLSDLRRLAGAPNVVVPLAEDEYAVIVIAPDADAVVERIDLGLGEAGFATPWYGFAQAAAGDLDGGELTARARGCLRGARHARIAAYHGLLPRFG